MSWTTHEQLERIEQKLTHANEKLDILLSRVPDLTTEDQAVLAGNTQVETAMSQIPPEQLQQKGTKTNAS